MRSISRLPACYGQALALCVALGLALDDAHGQASTSPAAPAAEYDGYKLVWSDEFQEDGRPDPKKWGFEHGFVRNDELQWYQPENARCERGLLVIEARRERVKNPWYDRSSRRWQENREHAEYTSASLLTRGLANWKYGRIEMRGRIDVRPGLWPSFWTLGVRRRWPACGEIDVMEYYRGTLLANAAWSSGRFRVAWDASRTPIAELGGQDWAQQFHVWRMDWNAEQIAISVDDRLLNEIDLSATHNALTDRQQRRRRQRGGTGDDAALKGANPFRQPHYLLLSLAVGGTNGGDPAETEFPARFEVDFVRIYQAK